MDRRTALLCALCVAAGLTAGLFARANFYGKRSAHAEPAVSWMSVHGELPPGLPASRVWVFRDGVTADAVVFDTPQKPPAGGGKVVVDGTLAERIDAGGVQVRVFVGCEVWHGE